MEKVRYGIIGFGGMGAGHAKFLGKIENAQLTAVADIDPAKLVTAKETLLETTALFSTGEELIKSGLVDAIIIATPHYDHPEIAIMGFAHGLHVMLEKPSGVYTKQVREMNEVAAKSDKLFGIMLQNRYREPFQKMQEMVAKGEIGEIRRVSVLITSWYRPQCYYDSATWRATWAGEGGGVLINQCPHHLDLWQWCVGMMPTKVRAFTHNGKWHDIEVEDDVTAYVEYKNGATGVFISSTGDYPGTNRFEIQGDRGKLVYENNNKLTLFKAKQSEKEFSATNKDGFGVPGIEEMEIECKHEFPGHRAVLENFTEAILHGTPLFIPGEEGIKELTLSNAMYLSGWLDKTIELPIDEALFLAELNKRRATSKIKTGSNQALNVEGTFTGV